MSIACADLETLSEADSIGWGKLSLCRTAAGPYSQPVWARAAVSAYRLKGVVLVASGYGSKSAQGGHAGWESSSATASDGGDAVAGVLPLVRFRHWLFGDRLVSLPFCDSGGGVWENDAAGLALVGKARDIAAEWGVPRVEIRRSEPLYHEAEGDEAQGHCGLRKDAGSNRRYWRMTGPTAERKVRMVLPLPDDPDVLMRAFKSKLRSQIRKPIKEGLSVRIGGLDQIGGFYRVFVENMRDIGSPVHSRRFIEEVVRQYGASARVFVVYQGDLPLAGSVTLGFREVLSNPWASSVRRFAYLSPNMLLYWSMLKYGCEQGFGEFDFGRSTVGGGTYRFKEQWGAHPEPLYWYRFTRGDVKSRGLDRDSGGMSRAVEIWKRLPLPVTRILGPRIRRYISL